MKVSKGLVLDKKTTLSMYRDCLKSVGLMNPNVRLFIILSLISLF